MLHRFPMRLATNLEEHKPKNSVNHPTLPKLAKDIILLKFIDLISP